MHSEALSRAITQQCRQWPSRTAMSTIEHGRPFVSNARSTTQLEPSQSLGAQSADGTTCETGSPARCVAPKTPHQSSLGKHVHKRVRTTHARTRWCHGRQPQKDLERRALLPRTCLRWRASTCTCRMSCRPAGAADRKRQVRRGSERQWRYDANSWGEAGGRRSSPPPMALNRIPPPLSAPTSARPGRF